MMFIPATLAFFASGFISGLAFAALHDTERKHLFRQFCAMSAVQLGVGVILLAFHR